MIDGGGEGGGVSEWGERYEMVWICVGCFLLCGCVRASKQASILKKRVRVSMLKGRVRARSISASVLKA